MSILIAFSVINIPSTVHVHDTDLHASKLKNLTFSKDTYAALAGAMVYVNHHT